MQRRSALSCSFLTLAAVLLLTAGCGDGLFSSDSDSDSYYDYNPDDYDYSPYQKMQIKGQVVSAFGISVDGTSYSDSEDFYTSELEKLRRKADEAGYEGWDVSFEAALGFNDLSSGMKVYVSPTGDKGTSAQTEASSSGKFAVEFQASRELSTAQFEVRAVKRLNVLLKQGSDARRFCYNLLGVERDVMVSDYREVRIDTFSTRMTSYSCESGLEGEGIPPLEKSTSAPVAASPAAPKVYAKVTSGEDAESVVNKLGDPASVNRSTRSYYSYDFYWTYSGLSGHSGSLSCILYFRNQKLTEYSRCPSSRFEFVENAPSADAQPAGRIRFLDTPAEVLTQWGLPALVTRASGGSELVWEYKNSKLTSSICTLKFSSGTLREYSGSCALGWLAHWTF